MTVTLSVPLTNYTPEDETGSWPQTCGHINCVSENNYFSPQAVCCSREQRLLSAPCRSVRSVRMYQQRGPHWTDFREIWCWQLLWKIIVENPNLFTTRKEHRSHYMHIEVGFIYSRRRKFAMTALLWFTRYFPIVGSDRHLNNNTENVFFIATMVTRTRHCVTLYVRYQPCCGAIKKR